MPKLTQENKENLNSHVVRKNIKLLLKTLPTKKKHRSEQTHGRVPAVLPHRDSSRMKRDTLRPGRAITQGPTLSVHGRNLQDRSPIGQQLRGCLGTGWGRGAGGSGRKGLINRFRDFGGVMKMFWN